MGKESGTPEYYLGDLESDCADDEIVSDVEDCRDAADQLGRDFGGSFTPFYSDVTSIRPKGCYYWKNTAAGDIYENVYFNYDTELPTITPVSDTRNINWLTGGVCKRVSCVCKDFVDSNGIGNCNLLGASTSAYCYITEESTCSDAFDWGYTLWTGETDTMQRLSSDACDD